MNSNSIAGVTIIGRKHYTNNAGKHVCVTPSLYSKGKYFHDLNNGNGLFINLTNWFWAPSTGFYGLFSIRNHDAALMDFYDFTTFDDNLTQYVDYLAGA